MKLLVVLGGLRERERPPGCHVVSNFYHLAVKFYNHSQGEKDKSEKLKVRETQKVPMQFSACPLKILLLQTMCEGENNSALNVVGN